MAYNKNTWADGPSGGTPLSAARLNHFEDGIAAAAVLADVGDAATPTGAALRAAFGSVESSPAGYPQLTQGSATFPLLPVETANDTGIAVRPKESETHGTGWVFGTAASFGFAGTGSPAEIAGAFGIYMEYGKAAPGQPIPKTTQGGYAVTNYWGPTTDDVAEGFSSAVLLKNGGVAYTQSSSTTALEGIAKVESGVTSTGKIVAVSGTPEVLAGGIATGNAYSFFAQNTIGGQASRYIAFGQRSAGGATENWGVWVMDPIRSESALYVNPADGDGVAAMDMAGVNVSSGTKPVLRIFPRSGTNLVGIRVGAVAAQTQNQQEWWASGATSANTAVAADGTMRSRMGFQVLDGGGGTIVGLTSIGLKVYSNSLFSTGAQSAALGTNSPATSPGAPNTWMKVVMPDNSTGYVPVWK